MAKIFISYSHKDVGYKDEIFKWLQLLEDIELKVWEDRQIKPGQKWHNVIQEEISTSNIILLLISTDFLVSDYIEKHELQTAISLAETGNAVVIPIFVRETFLMKFDYITAHQGLPNGKTIANSMDKDAAYTEIIKGIYQIILAKNLGGLPNQEIIRNFKSHISNKSLAQINNASKIYLASTSKKMKENRNSIFYELVGKKQYSPDWNHDVVPTPQQIEEIEKLPKENQAKKIQELLNDSILSIHILDDDHETQSLQSLQMELAKNKCSTSNFKCIVRSAISENSNSGLISDNSDLTIGNYTSRDEINATINDQLEELIKRKKKLEKNVKDKRSVYLLFHSNDLDHPCLPVVKLELDGHVNVEPALTIDGNEETIAEHERTSISDNDGVVIFYGKSSRNWALSRQKAVIKYNKTHKCLVLADPRPIAQKGLDVMGQFNPALDCPCNFTNFLSNLNNSQGK